MELLKQKITDIDIGLETSIIIMDNASVHVSKTSKDKIKKNEFSMNDHQPIFSFPEPNRKGYWSNKIEMKKEGL